MAQRKAYQGIDPFTVARRLGLNVPGWMSEGISPATLAGMLPGAGIKDSRDMGAQMAASRRLGNYGDMAAYGLGSAALAGSEILPGLLGSTARKGIKSGVKGLLGAPDYNAPAGGDPRYLGAAPDRSDFSFVRYTPKKNTPRVDASLAAMMDKKNPVRAQMLKDIARGEQLGGSDWYNTEELRDWFIAELGPQQGHDEWVEFMNLMGAASPGSKVPANIGNAAAMRQRLYSQDVPKGSNRSEGEIYKDDLLGVSKLDEAREIARGRKQGYGHKTQGLQELIHARQQQGTWSGDPEMGVSPAQANSTENAKPKGFSKSLLGNVRNIAADLHFTRYMAMASKDPRWLSTQADIGKETADEIKAIGGKKVDKYFRTRDVDGKPHISFNVKKAVNEGAFDIDDVVSLGSPQMWADMPNKSEYAAMEKLLYDIGQELGMTAPQVQANLWMGAADRTGVDPSSQGTFMELFRRRADERAKKTGSTREKVIRNFIKKKGLLVAPLGAVGLAGMQPEE